jgi:hypothetical protein
MSPFHKGFGGDVCGTWLEYLFWKAIFVDKIKDTRMKRIGFGLMEECLAKVDARVQCGT